MKRLDIRNVLLTLGLAALVACGGAGGGSGSSGLQPTAVSTGAAMVTLTDAPGDFVSYIVNVVSIQLKRTDGTVVETLPATTQVDFAQLVNLSEVISAAQVPEGNYASASLTLDYTGATIVVDNGSGGVAIAPANILNGANNNPLTSPNAQVTLALKLPTDRPLVVTKGSVANLALDFNLAASNVVSPAAPTSSTPSGTVTVTVNPVLAASVVPDAVKSIRVRGPLASVSNTASNTSYTVQVRPFYNGQGSHGDLVVQTTATTTFSINGTSYTGTAGLTALAGLTPGVLTAAQGSFDVSSKTFTAASVLAGTSIPGAGLDSVEGTVVARSGNVLTVVNGLIAHHDESGVQYGHQIAVTVGSATTVSKDTIPGAFAASDISVGQHAQFFGKLGTDVSSNRTLDASQGNARLQPTSLWGQYASSAAGVVTLSLQSLDGRPPSAFNFAGTGSSTANDALAATYTVVVPPALSTANLSAGVPVRFLGYVRPYGAAPPDFAAVSLVDFSSTIAGLELVWGRPGVTAPFLSTLSATHVVVSQATVQSALEHALQIGPQRLDPSTITSGLTLVPNPAAVSTQFVIAHRVSEKLDSFTSFADEVAALGTALNGTTTVLAILADGPFNSGSASLSVNRLVVVVND